MTAGPHDRTAAYEVVDALASWSAWRPFAEAAATAPRTSGVYLFRLPETGEIVYVGMAGPRVGSGVIQGLRGRLRIYDRGRGAVSGFGEAALDQALADEGWLEGQLASLRRDGPKRATTWAKEAITFLAPEVRWAECAVRDEALVLEKQIEGLLGVHGLWNRAAQKLRAGAAQTPAAEPASEEAPAVSAAPADQPEHDNDSLAAFALHGHSVDLDVLYREMYRYSVLVDGERIFDGGARDTRAVKWLLADLFDVPVAAKMHPVNNAIRSECRDRLDALGWATKGPGRSPRYVLHRELRRATAALRRA